MYKKDPQFRADVEEFKAMLVDAVKNKVFPLPTVDDILGDRKE